MATEQPGERPSEHLLLTALEAAVPLRIWEIRDWTLAERVTEARGACEVIAAEGDHIFFRGRKGETAHAFNSLVKGLAIGAYQPGGATFAGLHWCVDHSACVAADLEVVSEDWDDLPPAVADVPVREGLL